MPPKANTKAKMTKREYLHLAVVQPYTDAGLAATAPKKAAATKKADASEKADAPKRTRGMLITLTLRDNMLTLSFSHFAENCATENC